MSENNDWEAELAKVDHFPVIATLIPCAVAFVWVFMVARPEPYSSRIELIVAGFAGSASPATLIAWVVAFFVSIRRASMMWKIGSLFAAIAAIIFFAYLRALATNG